MEKSAFVWLLLLYFIIPFSYCILEGLNNKLSYKVEARAIAIEVINTIIQKSNESLINDNQEIFNNCFNMITSDLINGTFNHLVYNSGHGLMKIGNQKDCEEEDYTYHLFSLNISPETLDSPNEDLNEFIGLTTYNIGICLWKQCTNAIRSLLNKDINPRLFSFLYQYQNITDITQYNIKEDTLLTRRYYITVLFFIVPFFAIRMLLSWINDLFIEGDENDDEEKMKKNQLMKVNESLSSSLLDEYADLNKSIGKLRDNLKEKDKEKDKDKEKEKEYDESSSYISNDSLFKEYGKKSNVSQIKDIQNYMNNNFNRHGRTNSSMNSTSKPKTCKSVFGSCIDFFLGKISHRNLFNSTNTIFNESGIEILSGLRSFHMFFATIFRVFSTFYKVPSTSYGNLDFYNSYYLGIIKYASFSLYSWIYLDGFLFCYKLMFSLKKHKKQYADDIPFIFYIKFFFCSIIPKCSVFIIIFYTFTMNMNNFAVLYGKTFLFQKYYEETWKNYQCLAHPSLMLIPFYFSYFTKNSCFSIVIMVLNELYCLSIVLIIFYVMYRVKRRRLDICIISIFIINVLLTFFSNSSSNQSTKYTFDSFMGEELTFTYPHLMFNIFFFGSLCGLLYFYYLESVSDFQNYLQKNFYYPFKFCFSLMTLLSKLRKYIRYTVLSISFLFQILISFLYSLLKNYCLTERTFLFRFSFWFKFLYTYEKLIYIFFFSLICLMILFSSDKFWLKIIFRSKIFLTVSRVSFAFVLFSEVFIYLFFTLFDMSGIFWNYQNIWYISCVLCIGLLFLAEFYTVYFEIPIRMLIKDYLKQKTPDDKAKKKNRREREESKDNYSD